MSARTKQKQGSTALALATERGMGKEREKRSDGRQEKGREEGNATAAGEQFFKVFLPEQSKERLKIPSPFQEYLDEKELNRPVTLKGPSGKTWQVMLTSDSQGLSFGKGWQEFAHDHSLEAGHFLVFIYDGRSEFSVVVFNASGVRDKSAFDIHPSKEVTVKLEEEGVDAAGMSEEPATPRTARKRARQVNRVPKNDTVPKRRSSVQKRPVKRIPEAAFDTSKEALTIINNNKDSQCLLDQYSCSNKTRIRSKDVPRMGTFVSKKFRQAVMMSQRRLVTEEEIDLAFEKAKAFKSKYPFTVQVMMASYVYVGFFMNIPCEFVRESLPRASKMMKLWDPQGKSWEVNYVYYNDRSIAAFSAGWGKFAVGNNLEKFDVCVFELFKENNIKVHIYRVVQEITPLIRSSM